MSHVSEGSEGFGSASTVLWDTRREVEHPAHEAEAVWDQESSKVRNLATRVNLDPLPHFCSSSVLRSMEKQQQRADVLEASVAILELGEKSWPSSFILAQLGACNCLWN